MSSTDTTTVIPDRVISNAADAILALDTNDEKAIVRAAFEAVADQVTIHASVTHKRQAEAAAPRLAVEGAARRMVRQALRLDSDQFIETVIALGEGAFIAEVHAPSCRPLFGIVLDGKRHVEFFESLDLALLAVIGLRHGADVNDRSFEAAARVLRVPQED